jgi:hypothetical protein
MFDQRIPYPASDIQHSASSSPMSNQFRRTWQKHAFGQVLFTVEVDPAGDELILERHRRVGDVVRRLVDLFSAYRLPATWASGNPAQSPATTPVMRTGVEHELALLGDAGWAGASATRTQFARELTRRLGLARSVGLAVTSLVPRDGTIREHADVMLKQGISAVAVKETDASSGNHRVAPRALHYGLWELPMTDRLPMARSWIFGGSRSLVRRIRSDAPEGLAFHIAVDAAAIERESRNEAAIARVVRGVAELRDRGLVRIETLSTAAARLAAVPAVRPQRSILRRAA